MITAKEARKLTIKAKGKSGSLEKEMKDIELKILKRCAEKECYLDSRLTEDAQTELKERGFGIELLGGGRGIYTISWC